MEFFWKSLLFFLCFSWVHVYGDDPLLQRISELRLKSKSHNKFVTDLLENQTPLFPVFLEPTSPGNEIHIKKPDRSPELPLIDLPESVEEENPDTLSKNEPDTISSANEQAVPDMIPRESTTSSDLNQPLPQEDNLDIGVTTYEELYTSKIPQRRIGYYFGPFMGAFFPDNSVLKTSASKTPYDSSNGAMGGLRLGNDFGGTRIEAEYSFLTHKISSGINSGRADLHNLCSRFILEKSLGERADFRGGIGLGVVLVNQELGGVDYEGVGFSYDFLLGWSFRAMNNWSINLDYRHFLTAAHENYDRLQGHIVELSASFDL